MIVHMKIIDIGSFRQKGAVLARMISLLLLFSSKKNNTSGGNNPPPPAEAEVTILANETHQVIEGFGGATVFRPPNSPLANRIKRLHNNNCFLIPITMLM